MFCGKTECPAGSSILLSHKGGAIAPQGPISIISSFEGGGRTNLPVANPGFLGFGVLQRLIF